MIDDDYKLWLARAKSSLAISKSKSDDSIFYEDLCFQAQQAAEKAIKGFLIFHNVEPEKTHNLVLLIKELSKHTDIPEEINEVATLTDYAVQTRYPGDYTPVEKEEYENAVKVASDCINWIDKRTKQASYKIAQKERNQPYLGDL